jgi:hypothetical protein
VGAEDEVPASKKKNVHERRATRDAQLPKSDLNRIYRSLRKKPNVIACYLGFKYSKGRRRKTVAIVCLVAGKRPLRSLKPRQRIPKCVTWADKQGRRHEIETDVVHVRGQGKLCASTTGPGDGCFVLQQGSVGFAMGHPTFGNVVTTAGHCALHDNEPAGLYDFRSQPRPATFSRVVPPSTHAGRALTANCTKVSDYALVQPDDPTHCTNFHRSGIRVHAPPSQDPPLGTSVTLLTITGASKLATIIGLHAEAPIGKAGMMVDVILTTPTLIGGDSGGVLTITQTHEALGLAVGFIPVAKRRVISVFMPAGFVLGREGAAFL